MRLSKKYRELAHTQGVDSAFHAIWLVAQIRISLHYSPPDKNKMASRFVPGAYFCTKRSCGFAKHENKNVKLPKVCKYCFVHNYYEGWNTNCFENIFVVFRSFLFCCGIYAKTIDVFKKSALWRSLRINSIIWPIRQAKWLCGVFLYPQTTSQGRLLNNVSHFVSKLSRPRMYYLPKLYRDKTKLLEQNSCRTSAMASFSWGSLIFVKNS